jgi:hypothetical protein
MGPPCRDGCRSTGGLFSVSGTSESPALDPGYLSTQAPAQVDRSLMQGQLADGCPQLQLVPVTVTTMAVVTPQRHVHGEAATMPRLVHGTTPVPLGAGASRPLEAQQVEYLLHADLDTQPVEVHAWHGIALTPGPFRSLLTVEEGTGTVSGVSNGSIGTSPTRRGTAEPAGLLERRQGLAQALVLDPQRVAEFDAREDRAWCQQIQHLVLQAASRLVV